jgi:SAM-dependent methyltransferase
MPVSTVVLIHSPLVGPLTWQGVAARLEAAGHPTLVPDLRGANDYRAIVASLAGQVSAGSTVLVGHSGAGPILRLMADALGTVSSLVYVDARLPRPAVSWVDTAQADLLEHLKSTVDSDGRVAAWSDWWPAYELAGIIPDAVQRAAFVADQPRLPWTFFTEPGPDGRWRGPESYLLLSEPYEDAANRMRADGHPVVHLPLHHLAPLTHPDEVAAALLDLLDTGLSGLRFGFDATTYDDARMAYPDGLVDAALDYAGRPATAVEVGAGTGKASETFAECGLRLTCLEPDPGMATVLRGRFADRPQVTVVESTFEGWSPPAGGVALLYFASSWHWADPATRAKRAHDALAPGGTLALLDHKHAYADPEMEAAINNVFDVTAPQLRAGRPIGDAVIPERSAELTASGLFTDIDSELVSVDHPFSAARYLRLLGTFSDQLAIAPARRRRLHERIAEVVDELGGVVVLRLVSTLVLARRK